MKRKRYNSAVVGVPGAVQSRFFISCIGLLIGATLSGCASLFNVALDSHKYPFDYKTVWDASVQIANSIDGWTVNDYSSYEHLLTIDNVVENSEGVGKVHFFIYQGDSSDTTEVRYEAGGGWILQAQFSPPQIVTFFRRLDRMFGVESKKKQTVAPFQTGGFSY